jgi:hypothetical protein
MSTTKELAVFNRLITACLAKGYFVSVHDGEEWAVKRSSDMSEIREAATAVEMVELVIRDMENNRKVGWISIIWGNAPDGSELIADYTANPEMEALVKRVEA